VAGSANQVVYKDGSNAAAGSSSFTFDGTTVTAPILSVTRTAGTGTQSPSVTVTAPAHTALTASTESSDLNINLARTAQFATGTLTTQRAVRIQAPTYGFVGASTLTTASTVQIDSAPAAGSNATITNSYALRVLTGTDAGVGIVIQGSSSQSGDLFRIQNFGGTKLLYVDSNYSLYLARSLNLLPFNTSAGNTSELRFYELAANGTNYVGFKAGDSIASNVIWTLPTADGISGQVLSTNASGVLSWATATNEFRTSPAISAGVLALNCSSCTVFDVSLNATITSITFSNLPASSGAAYGMTLAFTADGTARTIAWPAAVKWAGGTAPTLTSTNGKVDIFVLNTWDGGTKWYAMVGGQNF
jgi:hypothetical protein